MPRTRRRFTAEFKTEAVRLLGESGRSLQAVAEELGVHANQLRGWRNERLAAGSAEALARQRAEAAELARLRREVKRLEQENEILRRAAAFFAREAARRALFEYVEGFYNVSVVSRPIRWPSDTCNYPHLRDAALGLRRTSLAVR